MPSITLKTSDETCYNVMLHMYDILSLDDSDYLNYKSLHELECYQKDVHFHFTLPKNGTYFIEHKAGQDAIKLKIVISDLIVNNQIVTINTERKAFQIVKNVVIIDELSGNNSNILNFIEKCHEAKNDKINKILNTKNDKICIKNFNGYNWEIMSLIPIRKKETLFLKEGQIENVCTILDEFISKNTYNDYVENGIPYKCNILLHGIPGVGKTSLIHFIASQYNIDISTMSINSELKESEFIQAFRSIDKNKTSGLSMLVIEDIDCAFSNRKENDAMRNHLTLQGILNTLDGFGSKEGLIVILTTNKPEVLDSALVRSRRIDHKIELSYINKYQASNMFNHFFKNNTDLFDIIWDQIKTYKIQPSSFHQFLFENRKNSDINSVKINDFIKSLTTNTIESLYT